MSDLIDREDAISALRFEYPAMPWFKESREEWLIKTEGYRKAEEIIMKMPSARPKGEWIYVVQGWHTLRRCSVCKWAQTNSDSKYIGYKYNFCPSCGADMGGE